MKTSFRKLWYHPWLVAACNLTLVMLLYTFSRLFFYFVNRDFFSDISGTHLWELLSGGMRFDLTAILYLNSLYLILMLVPLRLRSNPKYITAAKWCYWIPNITGIVVNCADIVYFRFTDRRTTCRIFTEFQNDDNLMSIFLQSMAQYWYVTLFAIATIVTIILCTRKNTHTDDCRPKWLYYITETALFTLSIYFIVIGIRGGFGKYTRPITISNAMQYADRPNETAIVLNTPFSLMKSLENETYINPKYFPKEEELEAIFTPVHQPVQRLKGSEGSYPDEASSERQNCKNSSRNVVIFILESFSKEYIGFFNHDLDNGTYQGYTPFLDSLLQYSRSYPLSFASGRKSIDAMPSVLSGIPMLIEPYIVTPYSTNAISSIADCLNQEGYTTAFFHGAPNGSMGFQTYARSAGFQRYYGMDEYDGEDAFDGTWAIWDEEFLQYYARTMNTLHEPFCTAVFTASSHHPFRVPERYTDFFPKGTKPIHQCIGYSDNALREFFRRAKENTLFVFTADHTNQITHPEYTTAKGLFEVPLFFYLPDNSLAGSDMQPTSQTDIMPSVLAYLGYDKPFFAFGEDILTEEKSHPYAICYNHPVYQIFSDSLLLQFDGRQTTAVYNFKHDKMLQHNIESRTEETQFMETYLKAYIQQYISRMINNQLTAK